MLSSESCSSERSDASGTCGRSKSSCGIGRGGRPSCSACGINDDDGDDNNDDDNSFLTPPPPPPPPIPYDKFRPSLDKVNDDCIGEITSFLTDTDVVSLAIT